MKKIKLPKDEAAHSRGSEWWYFNGNLKSKDREYGFMISFFKMDMIKNRPKWFLWPIKTGYLVHSHLSDLTNKNFFPHYEHFIKMPYEKFTEKNKLFNHYRQTLLKEIKKGVYHLRFFNKPYKFDLVITTKKPVVLHGKKGIIGMGKKDYSYYYSFTNMHVKGTIKKQFEDPIKVDGTAWMDHQWGNFTLQNKQWDWLSIQLNDNTEIMTFKILDKATQDTYFYTSIIDKKGKLTKIKDAQLNPIKRWKSKKTEILYPIHWNLKIPSKKLNLTIKPDFNEQEMHDGILKYWEGSCSVTGTQNKKRVNGRAYMELVGHEKLKSKLF
jgi:predicted secreted hydrolase